MADWLDIANTLINLQNQQRLSDISRAQQQTANQLAIAEYRRQRDNALLSQLVDIVVKVRKCAQNQQYLDAFLSSGIGIISFSQYYPEIVDADIKFKMSDIQIKLIETIHSMISNKEIKIVLQKSLAQYLSDINASLQRNNLQLRQSHYRLVLLNPDKVIQVGDKVAPIEDISHQVSENVIFRKGVFYKVIQITNTEEKAFYLINDNGHKWRVFFGKDGGAKLFCFFDPPLPDLLENEISGWELCDKLFNDDFINENIKSIRSAMLDIIQQAYAQSNLSRDDLANFIINYKQLLKNIIAQSFKKFESQASNYKLPRYIKLYIGIFIFLLLCLIIIILSIQRP